MSKKKTESLAPETVVLEYIGDPAAASGLPGVPLADLTLDQWNQIPIWLRPSVIAHPDYKKVVDAPLVGEEHPKSEEAQPSAAEPQPTDQPAA